jgi:hypothetical protein
MAGDKAEQRQDPKKGTDGGRRGSESQGAVAMEADDSHQMTSDHHGESLQGTTAPSKKLQQVNIVKVYCSSRRRRTIIFPP